MKRRKIFNLTQHKASEEQRSVGVVDPTDNESEEYISSTLGIKAKGMKSYIHALLTFESLPSPEEVKARAKSLAMTIPVMSSRGITRYAMIGGAPYLMAPLEKELKKRGITPLYAFSKRESVETVQPDGSTKKEMVFRHLGFVEV